MQIGYLGLPKTEIAEFSFTHTLQTQLAVDYSRFCDTPDGKRIIQNLNNDSRIRALEGVMVSHGTGGRVFDLATLGMWFLWCINEYGEELAKRYLDAFLDSDEIEAVFTLWVMGMEADAPIALDDGYSIVPTNAMVCSADMAAFSTSHFPDARRPVVSPRCALTKRCKVKKALALNPEKQPDAAIHLVRRRLHEIAMLLNAVSGVTCLPFYSTAYVDPTTPFGLFNGSGGGLNVYDVQGIGTTKVSAAAVHAVSQLLKSYDRSDKKEQQRLLRILARLSQAKRRIEIEDKLLDIGIALEMLLLTDNTSKEQLSLTFRLRGSWLLADSPGERQRTYDVLKQIYNYRSIVAHTGELTTNERQRAKQLFPTYQDLAENICQKLIKSGRVNWEKLVLGLPLDAAEHRSRSSE